MSRLISIALPLKGEDFGTGRKSSEEDQEMESTDQGSNGHRSAILEKRMKAMNYIGSLMTQTTVVLEDQFYS